MERMRNEKKASLALMVFALALTDCGTCNIPLALNFGGAFGWRGYADTNLSMSSFTGGDYTLAFRFMVQFPNAYTGPIVSDSATGNFWIAKDAGKPRLIANFGGTQATFSNPVLPPNVWLHLTVVHQAGKNTLFLNGTQICPDVGDCAFAGGGNAPSGVLRFARAGDGVQIGGHEDQFYGFVDDVAVFDKALPAGDLAALATAPRLTGTEPGLFAGFTFDPYTPTAMPLPPNLKGAVTFKTVTPGTVLPGTPAYPVLLSQARDSASDAKLLPVPFQQTVLQLPFPAGEAWQVIQGWDNPGGSHNDRASFCWDFTLAGHPQADTKGKKIFAAAGGTVAEIRNDRDSCQGYPASYVMITQAPVEIGAYLHFVKGSVLVSSPQVVATGAELAQAGDTGNTGCGAFHLHFGMHTQPESQAGSLVTFPGAFSKYEVSDDSGKTWRLVDRGVPQNGQWVRNPSKP